MNGLASADVVFTVQFTHFFFFANDLVVQYANQYYQKPVTKSSENIVCTCVITIIDAAVVGLSKNNTIIKDNGYCG